MSPFTNPLSPFFRVTITERNGDTTTTTLPNEERAMAFIHRVASRVKTPLVDVGVDLWRLGSRTIQLHQ